MNHYIFLPHPFSQPTSTCSLHHRLHPQHPLHVLGQLTDQRSATDACESFQETVSPTTWLCVARDSVCQSRSSRPSHHQHLYSALPVLPTNPVSVPPSVPAPRQSEESEHPTPHRFDQFSYICLYRIHERKWKKGGFEGASFLFERCVQNTYYPNRPPSSHSSHPSEPRIPFMTSSFSIVLGRRLHPFNLSR